MHILATWPMKNTKIPSLEAKVRAKAKDTDEVDVPLAKAKDDAATQLVTTDRK